MSWNSPANQIKSSTSRRCRSNSRKAAPLEKGLAALKKFGTVEVLAQPRLLMKFPQDAEVRVGQQLPISSKETRPESTGEPEAKGKFEELGFSLGVHGRWASAADPTRAVLTLKVQQRSLEEPPQPVISPQDPGSPMIVARVWESAFSVQTGRSVWLTSPARAARSLAARPLSSVYGSGGSTTAASSSIR